MKQIIHNRTPSGAVVEQKVRAFSYTRRIRVKQSSKEWLYILGLFFITVIFSSAV